MLFYIVRDDKIVAAPQVTKLGFDINKFRTAYPPNFDGIIPIVRTCSSLGDWGILSGLPRAIKELYPNAKVAIPTAQWCERVFGNVYTPSGIWQDPWQNVNTIFDNNPFVDIRFNSMSEIGLLEVATDHYRVFDPSNINVPLAEQMFRFFGGDPTKHDLRPELYFSPEEIEIGDKLLKDLNIQKFGTLLLASSFIKGNETTGKLRDNDEVLRGNVNLYTHDNRPEVITFLYYSDFDISETEWNDYNLGREPQLINLKLFNLSVRVQLYLKTQAVVNIGYQSGMNDSVGSRYCDMVTLSPYSAEELGSNITRGVYYYIQSPTDLVTY